MEENNLTAALFTDKQNGELATTPLSAAKQNLMKNKPIFVLTSFRFRAWHHFPFPLLRGAIWRYVHVLDIGPYRTLGKPLIGFSSKHLSVKPLQRLYNPCKTLCTEENPKENPWHLQCTCMVPNLWFIPTTNHYFVCFQKIWQILKSKDGLSCWLNTELPSNTGLDIIIFGPTCYHV